MNPKPFIVDSNFFIQAYRSHYPMDIVPGFWSKVKELAECGLLISIDKVKAELYLNSDELTNWCKTNLPESFFKDTSEIVPAYAKLSAWAYSKSGHYTQGALNEFLDADEADAWLVAYACTYGNVIVTQISNPAQKNRVKIPDACVPFGIKWVNTIEMFRELGQRF